MSILRGPRGCCLPSTTVRGSPPRLGGSTIFCGDQRTANSGSPSYRGVLWCVLLSGFSTCSRISVHTATLSRQCWRVDRAREKCRWCTNDVCGGGMEKNEQNHQ